MKDKELITMAPSLTRACNNTQAEKPDQYFDSSQNDIMHDVINEG